jgi:hypothetical protein
MLKKTLKITLVTALSIVVLLAAICAGIYALFDSDKGQQWLFRNGLEMLAETTGTRVDAKHISVNLHQGKVVLYGVEIDDLNKVTMLKVDTLDMRVNFLGLLNRKVQVKGITLHGAQGVFYKKDKKSPANYKFFLDALKNKKTTEIKEGKKKEKKLLRMDMQLHYADIDRMSLKYDITSARMKGGDTLDANHLRLENFHIRLKGRLFMSDDNVTDDKASVTATDLRVLEKKSGFKVTMAQLDMYATRRRKGNNQVDIDIKDVKGQYLRQWFGIHRMQITQQDYEFNMNQTMELAVDSFKYKNDNGKPHKRTGKPHRGYFDKGHMNSVVNLRATVKAYSIDSITANVKHMWAYDKASGLFIKDMRTHVVIDDKFILLKNTKIWMQRSLILMPKAKMTYKVTPGNKEKGIKTKVELNLDPCVITADVHLQDIAKPFAPVLSDFTTPLKLSLVGAGTLDRFTFNNILVTNYDKRLVVTGQGDLCNVLKKRALCLHFNKLTLKETGDVKQTIIKHFAKKSNIKMMHQLKTLGNVSFRDGTLGVFFKRITMSGFVGCQHGEVFFDFALNGFKKRMDGTIKSKCIDFGKIMDVKGLNPISFEATYSFNTKKDKLRKDANAGLLPEGWIKAQITNSQYKIIKIKRIDFAAISDGREAKGVMRIPQGPVDLVVHFKYLSTRGKQSYAYNTALKKHRDSFEEVINNNAEEMEQKLDKRIEKKIAKQKAKEEKKARKDSIRAVKEKEKAIREQEKAKQRAIEEAEEAKRDAEKAARKAAKKAEKEARKAAKNAAKEAERKAKENNQNDTE